MTIRFRLKLLITVLILSLLNAGCTAAKETKDKDTVPTSGQTVPQTPGNTTKPGDTNTNPPVTEAPYKEAPTINDSFIFPDSQTIKLSESDVLSLKLELLPFARNEIYARRGYVFSNKVFQDYFESKPWYKPDPNFSTNSLSNIEKYNAELIKSIEDQLKNKQVDISSKVTVYKANNTVSLDLNGDGIKENITYLPSKGQLLINDKTVTFDFADPVETFGIADINSKDKFLEVMISDYGPSDDYKTFYYYFDGTNIVKMGETQGLFDFGIKLDGFGKIAAQSRGSILQTWFFDKSFKLNSQHKLSEIPQELYSTNCEVTLKIQLKLYKNKGDASPSIVINNGERLNIIGTDNKAWCLLKASNGTKGWIAVDKFSVIRNNGLQAPEVFEGLSYAD